MHGRQLRLIAADDGYEPARAAETMKQLFEKDQVFGVVGNVGTPTAVVAVPYALQRKMLFFGGGLSLCVRHAAVHGRDCQLADNPTGPTFTAPGTGNWPNRISIPDPMTHINAAGKS
ncbi:MAG: ABC transporter substrate-binding protein [Pseudolabrys sp.]